MTASFFTGMAKAASAPLPPGVGYAARRSLFNVLATGVGAAPSATVEILLGAAHPGSSAVLGRDAGTDWHWAALLAGTAAHLDDFDDTHLTTVIHPGAASMAVLLALQPEVAASGEQFLTAFALGCESQLRIGLAISPGHYDRGWHITGTAGVFGAAVAAGVLLGLDADGLSRALELAATMTLGHREGFGSMTKPFHPGKAAANGVAAARLAALGLSGVPLPAALSVLAASVDHGQFDRGWEADWELERNTFKPYPCGIVAHPSIDAARTASGQVSDIESVTVECHPLVPELMGRRHPADGLQSRFSVYHAIACGLLFGAAGLDEFSDACAVDPAVRRLRDLITLLPSDTCPRDSARLRVYPGPVEVNIAHARGSLDRPLTDDELLAKAESLMAPVLGAGSASRVRAAVSGLAAAAGLDDLLSAVAGGVSGVRPPVASAEGPGLTSEVISLIGSDVPELAFGRSELARFATARAAGADSVAARAVRQVAADPEGLYWRAWADGTAAASVAGVDWVAVCAAVSVLEPRLDSDSAAAATAVGYRVAELVAAALGSGHVAIGWSVAATAGTIGAAAAAGRLLGLDSVALRNMLGLAATQAAGLVAATGTDAGPLQLGKAAANAVEAALLAAGGFTSAAQPLEGRRGMVAVMTAASLVGLDAEGGEDLGQGCQVRVGQGAEGRGVLD
jgi:2-methylcitrate dehydratase PrpD